MYIDRYRYRYMIKYIYISTYIHIQRMCIYLYIYLYIDIYPSLPLSLESINTFLRRPSWAGAQKSPESLLHVLSTLTLCCISGLLVHSKASQLCGLNQHKRVVSPSFCGWGAWSELSWVLCSGTQQVEIKVSTNSFIWCELIEAVTVPLSSLVVRTLKQGRLQSFSPGGGDPGGHIGILLSTYMIPGVCLLCAHEGIMVLICQVRDLNTC